MPELMILCLPLTPPRWSDLAFFADKAYFLDYFTLDRPIRYQSQYAGDWMIIWKVNNMVIDEINKFIEKPQVVVSFPDMAVLQYEPFKNLQVQEVFLSIVLGWRWWICSFGIRVNAH